jgi:hypothetical protein
MNIYTPDAVEASTTPQSEVLVNVFAGSPKSKVEMRVGNGAWMPLQRVEREDPAYAAAKQLEEDNKKLPGRPLPTVIKSPHIWGGNLPAGLPKGTHLVQARTTDMFGRTHSARRIMRVT